jgi:hypothetical protein
LAISAGRLCRHGATATLRRKCAASQRHQIRDLLNLAEVLFNNALLRGEKQYQAEAQADQAHITQDHIFASAYKPAKRKSQGDEDEKTGEQHDGLSFLRHIPLMTWLGNKWYSLQGLCNGFPRQGTLEAGQPEGSGQDDPGTAIAISARETCMTLDRRQSCFEANFIGNR